MANSLTDAGRQAFLEGDVPVLTCKLKLYLCDAADWTVDLASDATLADIPAGARVANVQIPTSGRDTTDGVLDLPDVTFSAVTGDPCELLALVKAADADASADDAENAQTLLFVVDTATGLPVTPNGGDISVQWDSGANKVFKL